MKKLLVFSFLLFCSLCFSQDSNQMINEARYRQQVSNGAYEKALHQMQSSANAVSDEKLKQLNEMFEFNFAQNKRFQSKLKLLNDKKMQIDSKMIKLKSDAKKESLNEKVNVVNAEISQLNDKLKANVSELKMLQDAYNNLLNK